MVRRGRARRAGSTAHDGPCRSMSLNPTEAPRRTLAAHDGPGGNGRDYSPPLTIASLLAPRDPLTQEPVFEIPVSSGPASYEGILPDQRSGAGAIDRASARRGRVRGMLRASRNGRPADRRARTEPWNLLREKRQPIRANSPILEMAPFARDAKASSASSSARKWASSSIGNAVIQLPAARAPVPVNCEHRAPGDRVPVQ